MITLGIDHKPIKGKKIRSRSFYPLFALLVIDLVILLGNTAIALTLRVDLFNTIFITQVYMLIPLGSFALASKKVCCILTQDRVYFFAAYAEIGRANSRCRKVSLCCNGSMLYADILDMHQKIEGRRSAVAFFGENFTVEVSDSGRWLMWRVKAMRNRTLIFPGSEASPSPEPERAVWVRKGIWGDIWNACESGAFERQFEDMGELVQLNMCDETDTIDIGFNIDGNEIFYNMEDIGVYMYAVKNDASQTLALSQISDADSLWLRMREFAMKNT